MLEKGRPLWAPLRKEERKETFKKHLLCARYYTKCFTNTSFYPHNDLGVEETGRQK